MYTICNYNDVKNINNDQKLMIEVKKEIENIHECVGKDLKKDRFTIKEYGKIVIIENKIEFQELVIGKTGKYILLNIESEQWIIDNDIYYIVNGVEESGLFIQIIIKDEIYRKLDEINKYLIEHNLKKIKSKNGKVQILSY